MIMGLVIVTRVFCVTVISLVIAGCGTMFRGQYAEPSTDAAAIKLTGVGRHYKTAVFISDSVKECKEMKKAGYISPENKVNADVDSAALRGMLKFAVALQNREEQHVVTKISANKPVQVQGYVRDAAGGATYKCGPVTQVFTPSQGAQYRAEFNNENNKCSLKIYDEKDNSVVPTKAAHCVIADF